MVVGKCRTCGETIRSRSSKNGSANGNFLKAVRKHYKKKHPNTMSRRISNGLKNGANNPSIQDFAKALATGTREALSIYRAWTERQYQAVKIVMDALEPYMLPHVALAWNVIESIHDAKIKLQ